MITFAKLMAATAALIASLTFAWTATHGVDVRHNVYFNRGSPLSINHHTDQMFINGDLSLMHDGSLLLQR
jgi:hypothetical protein